MSPSLKTILTEENSLKFLTAYDLFRSSKSFLCLQEVNQITFTSLKPSYHARNSHGLKVELSSDLTLSSQLMVEVTKASIRAVNNIELLFGVEIPSFGIKQFWHRFNI